MNYTLNAFALGTPSVFVVWSPFQVLCAIAALSQLNIEEYLFLVYLPRGGARNNQIICILNRFKIKYKSLKDVSSNKARLYYLIRSLLVRKTRYSRLFIGDFKEYLELYVGCGFVSKGSVVVYLDDGNQAISLFKNRYVDNGHSYSGNPKINLATRNLISIVKRMSFMHNFLTIYYNIPNPLYNIRKLNIDCLSIATKVESTTCRDVFIIGTNMSGFCGPLNIPEEDFIKLLDLICKNIRRQYPLDTIYYIPHGRETKSYAESICLKYEMEFKRSNNIIEVEMLDIGCYPKAVYGFTSNALYTLKSLFPFAYVENILLKGDKNNPFFMEYLEVSKYYEKAGIILHQF